MCWQSRPAAAIELKDAVQAALTQSRNPSGDCHKNATQFERSSRRAMVPRISSSIGRYSRTAQPTRRAIGIADQTLYPLEAASPPTNCCSTGVARRDSSPGLATEPPRRASERSEYVALNVARATRLSLQQRLVAIATIMRPSTKACRAFAKRFEGVDHIADQHSRRAAAIGTRFG